MSDSTTRPRRAARSTASGGKTSSSGQKPEMHNPLLLLRKKIEAVRPKPFDARYKEFAGLMLSGIRVRTS